MQAIFKYPFEVSDDVRIETTEGAKFLSVQVQNGFACAWALVDPGAPWACYHLQIRGTGQPVEASELGRFLGMFQMHDGKLVFPAFVVED